MQLKTLPDCHLTYCTNIHPGETWPEVRQALLKHVPAVKARLRVDAPFGVGLRLSARASRELEHAEAREELRDLLDSRGLYVFTINGFPFGSFHGTRVKERVYTPDWRSTERLAYSNRLAWLLSELLPDTEPAISGSVSTVPGAFRSHVGDPAAVEQIADNLIHHAAELWRLREVRGQTIVLGLEPEPECLLETTDEAVRFFEEKLFAAQAVARMARLTGLDRSAAEEALRRHLGVCFDVCHAAVEYEDPKTALRILAARGITIAKVQLSAALRIAPVGAGALERLSDFDDGIYLHQVVARSGGEVSRHLDLPQALAAHAAGERADEWRVHFHVPVFLEDLGEFASTQSDLASALDCLRGAPAAPHLEIETYTWNVLPERHRGLPVDAAVAREFQWVMDRVGR